MSALPEDPNEFEMIQQYWHFDRLCQDLARYKGKPLSQNETKWLKCLLLGYESKEISQITSGADSNGSSASIRTSLSKHLYPLITDLIHEKAQREVLTQGPRMLIWLERFGYRKALMCPPKSCDINPRLAQFETDRV
jgi:hypothetical protein